VAKLGEAGQGQVWRAVQLSTGRHVALKVPRIGLLSSKKTLARFEREVEIVAQLQHPHIARIIDSGIHRGLYYYAMDLIEGKHLDQYVRDNGLSQRQILELMRTICEAVQHAHQNGVIHRDLKPSNIIVTPEGDPYVVDFGLAKNLADDEAGVTVSLDGEAAGTPAYMSPEQAAGHMDKVDVRTDVYSLGTILFKLLTGQYPHDLSGSHLEILHRISQVEVVRPRTLNPQIDRNLEALLLKALERDPDRRYPSAGELAKDIDNYLEGAPLGVQPRCGFHRVISFVREHPAAVVGITATILLAGLCTVWTINRAGRKATSGQGLARVGVPLPTDSLIAHWALDELSGDIASDSIGAHHGILDGNPKWVPGGGRIGGAMEFDGVDDRVGISPAGVAGLRQFTIALWVKPMNLHSGRVQQFVFLANQRAVVRHDGYNAPDRGQLHFFIHKEDGTSGDIRVSDVLEEGVFQHIAASYDGNTMRLYLNGRLLSTSSEGVPLVSNSADNVCLSAGPQEAFQGFLDDVRIYSRALTEKEIETFAGPPAPRLLAHWRLDESDGKIAYDSDGTHHGILSGSPTWAPEDGKIGGALQFEGSDEVMVAEAVPNALQRFTIAFWVRLDEMESGRIQRFVTIMPEKACMRLGAKKDLHLYMRTTDGQWKHLIANCPMITGVFHHLAATYDGENMRLCLDGKPFASLPVQGELISGVEGRVYMGSREEPLHGLLDDVRIYDRALDDSEIMAIMTPLVPRLLAHWTFDESVGNVAHDSAGVRHGLLAGQPVWTPNGGRVGGALEFDGIDDFVNVNAAGCDLLERFTIVFWMKIHSLPEGRVQRIVTIPNEKIRLTTGEDLPGRRQLHFRITKADGTWGEIRVNGALEAGVFHHFGMTYDGTTMRLYRDGSLLASSHEGVALVPGSNDRLDFSAGQGQALHGLLDDVRVYDEALSESQIRALVVPPAPALVAHWRLDESSGDVAQDSTGGHHGTLHGNPAWQPDGGRIGGALLFDGVDDYIDCGNLGELDTANEITVAAWVKVREFDKPWQAIVTKGNNFWRIQRDAERDCAEFACCGPGAGRDHWLRNALGDVNINDGQWHHVAGTFDGLQMCLYVDGRLDKSTPVLVAPGTMGITQFPVTIGENAEAKGRTWHGLIDDVRIYSYALTLEEIEAVCASSDSEPQPRPK